MKKQNVITLQNVVATNEVFSKLNNLRRWTDFTTQSKYNELAKQAFNCLIAYLLAKCAEENGKTVCFSHFPRIAIGRAFAKVYVYFDTPEHKIQEMCDMSGISKKDFDDVSVEIITEKTNSDFADFIAKGIGEYEVRIYKAATKIATYVELLEHQATVQNMEKVGEVYASLQEYMDIPGVKEFADTKSEFWKILRKLSDLRNQNRWATSSYNVECSVLGHLFDTGVFAYLFALAENDFDEEHATRMFFMGIFHDVAETWTKDIPSPIKNRIPGFRAATEAYELKVMEQNVYTKVPHYLEKAIKEVMMEDEANASFKKKLKEADYLSADSECHRNLLSGTRDSYFAEAIIRPIAEDTSPLYKATHEYFEKYVVACFLPVTTCKK